MYSSNEAREARLQRQKVQIRYPAKLFIGGQFIRDSVPDWSSTLQQSRLTCPQKGEIRIPEQTFPKTITPCVGKTNATVYLEQTDVDSKTESDSDDDCVFTSTQIHQDANLQNVNKHAHLGPGETSMNEVSRDRAHSNEQVPVAQRIVHGLPATKTKSSKESKARKSRHSNPENNSKSAQTSRTRKDNTGATQNNNPTTSTTSGSETINRNEGSQQKPLEHRNPGNDNSAATTTENAENTHL